MQQEGVTVIHIFNDDELERYQKGFNDIIETFPEYLVHDIYVQGAFGALGNPASFHNPVVRHIRLHLMVKLMDHFKEIANGRNLEQLMDRMCIRRKGVVLGSESWHRDICPISEDDIFGGWVNLSKENQYFSCIPGTHLVKGDKRGFAKETEVDKSKKVRISVAPGHIILFYQNILHEVLPGKIKNRNIRLYVGFRLTDSNKPLYDISKVLEEQGTIRLPGGGYPLMYSPLHLSFHSDKVKEWSKSFLPVCISSGLVNKKMLSLKEYGLPLYLPYTEEEVAILHPNKSWKISGLELSL